ncbi:MAG: hypothetical protein IJ797_00435, partial [Selenomonadaceae bacterium]|nr:hypothetical protein [Selenomonadaceae bacterium]
MNVAILGTSFVGWGGGVDLIKRYIHAMRLYSEINITLFVQISQQNMEALTKPFLSECPELDIVLYRNIDECIRLMKVKNIDIVFPSGKPLGNIFPFPWVGYICDLQHKHFPQNFSSDECRDRDNLFYNELKDSDSLIVTSEDVKNGLRKYYPEIYDENKIYATPVFHTLREEWLHLENISLDKYNLPEKYFLISNQFWLHKDHKTACEALAILHNNNPSMKDIHIVCTGVMYDYRDPNSKHIKDLMSKIKELHIEDKVHFL